MKKWNAIWAVTLIVCTFGACASDETSEPSNEPMMAEPVAMDASHVDPVIARQRALEAEASAISAGKSWGVKLGGHHEVARCWAQGGLVLCEAWDIENREWDVHCIDIANGRLRWMLVLGENRLARVPQVGNGTIAFLTENDGGMIVVDSVRGSRIWGMRAKLGVVPASAAISNGATVYLASHLSQRMAAVSGGDGRKGWDFTTAGTCRRAPVLSRGLARQLLIYGTDQGELVALDARGFDETGPNNSAWNKPLNGAISGDPTYAWVAMAAAAAEAKPAEGEGEGESGGDGEAAPAAPAAAATGGFGLVVVPCADGWLYGVDPATGRSRWIQRSNKAFVGRPVVIDGRVYATNQERMFCIDADTGHRLWYPASMAGLGEYEKNETFGTPEGFETADRVLAASGDRVLFLRGHDTIMRVKPADGTVEGEYSMGAFDFFLTNSATGDLLVATKDGYVMAFK